jgi:hypothetical protein
LLNGGVVCCIAALPQCGGPYAVFGAGAFVDTMLNINNRHSVLSVTTNIQYIGTPLKCGCLFERFACWLFAGEHSWEHIDPKRD